MKNINYYRWLYFIFLFAFILLFSTPSLALIPGDFGSANNGPPDCKVDFEDLMIFALAYGTTSADDNWNEVCDIAGSNGSTTPDGVVDFEDLMIFAMNYGKCECIPPSAPNLSDPGTTLTSPATYTVSWSAVSGATGYKIQEATSSNFSSGLQEYPVTSTNRSFSHTVTSITTYYYRVAAVDDCGQSGWSNTVDMNVDGGCTSPPVSEVSALAYTYHSTMSKIQSKIDKLIETGELHRSYPIVEPNNTTKGDVVYAIYGEWAAYLGAEGYRGYRSVNGGSYTLIAEGIAEPGYDYYSFTDINVIAGTTYSYYVTAYGTGWETCPSQSASTTPLPSCSLISPTNGVTISNPTPAFSWSSVGVSSYPYGAISSGESDLWVYDDTAGSTSWWTYFTNMTTSSGTYNQDGQATALVSGHNYIWDSWGYGYDSSGNLIAISESEDWGFDFGTITDYDFYNLYQEAELEGDYVVRDGYKIKVITVYSDGRVTYEINDSVNVTLDPGQFYDGYDSGKLIIYHEFGDTDVNKVASWQTWTVNLNQKTITPDNLQVNQGQQDAYYIIQTPGNTPYNIGPAKVTSDGEYIANNWDDSWSSSTIDSTHYKALIDIPTDAPIKTYNFWLKYSLSGTDRFVQKVQLTVELGTPDTCIIRLEGDLDFGSVQVGTTSQKILTVYNDGNSTLTVTGIDCPTGFSGDWSGDILAGGHHDVTVTFAPTQAIVYNGTLTVNSNKTSGTNTKSVSGTGTEIPTVTTQAATNIGTNSVTANGTITSDGGSKIIEKGFEYGLTQTPTWSVKETDSDLGTGAFSNTISDLDSDTTYWVKAYAVNNEGKSVNEDWKEFHTLPDIIITNEATFTCDGQQAVTSDCSITVSFE